MGSWLPSALVLHILYYSQFHQLKDTLQILFILCRMSRSCTTIFCRSVIIVHLSVEGWSSIRCHDNLSGIGKSIHPNHYIQFDTLERWPGNNQQSRNEWYGYFQCQQLRPCVQFILFCTREPCHPFKFGIFVKKVAKVSFPSKRVFRPVAAVARTLNFMRDHLLWHEFEHAAFKVWVSYQPLSLDM